MSYEDFVPQSFCVTKRNVTNPRQTRHVLIVMCIIGTISTQMYGECDNSTHFLNFELKQGSFLEVNRWEINILEKNFLIFEVNNDISPFIIFLFQYRELFSRSRVFKWRLKPWRLTWFSANQVWIWVKIGDFLEVKLQNVHRT